MSAIRGINPQAPAPAPVNTPTATNTAITAPAPSHADLERRHARLPVSVVMEPSRIQTNARHPVNSSIACTFGDCLSWRQSGWSSCIGTCGVGYQTQVRGQMYLKSAPCACVVIERSLIPRYFCLLFTPDRGLLRYHHQRGSLGCLSERPAANAATLRPPALLQLADQLVAGVPTDVRYRSADSYHPVS